MASSDQEEAAGLNMQTRMAWMGQRALLNFLCMTSFCAFIGTFLWVNAAWPSRRDAGIVMIATFTFFAGCLSMLLVSGVFNPSSQWSCQFGLLDLFVCGGGYLAIQATFLWRQWYQHFPGGLNTQGLGRLRALTLNSLGVALPVFFIFVILPNFVARIFMSLEGVPLFLTVVLIWPLTTELCFGIPFRLGARINRGETPRFTGTL